jgi:hypothetical protein
LRFLLGKSVFIKNLELLAIENSKTLCKNLPANPCREIGVGWLCQPLSDNLKRGRL